MKNMSSGKTVFFFEVLGRDHLMPDNRFRQIGRVSRDRLYDLFRQNVALGFPIAVP